MKNETQNKALFGKKRRNKAALRQALLTLAVLAVVVAVNLLMGLLPHSIARPNLTGADTFDISGKSLDWLAELDKEVTLYITCKDGKAKVDSDLYSFLLGYQDASSGITVKVLDTSLDEEKIKSYTADGTMPADLSVIVESGDRYKLIDNKDLYFYYNTKLGISVTADQLTAYLKAFASASDTSSEEYYYGYMLYTNADYTLPYFNGESRVTNAINFVTRERVPVIYVYTGSGCSPMDATLQKTLSDICYEVRTALSLENLPDDCDALMIYAPQTDLSEAEVKALSAYLEQGGKLMLGTFWAFTDLPRLKAVLNSYGLDFGERTNAVLEGNPNYAFSDSSKSYPYMFKAHINKEHPVSEGFQGDFVVYYGHEIRLTQTEGVTQTPWLYTSEAGSLILYNAEEKDWDKTEEKGVYNVGVIAEKGETQIVWISSADAMSSTMNVYTSNGNFNLLISAFHDMTDMEDDSIAIDPVEIPTANLFVTVTWFAVLAPVLVLGLPAVCVVVGVVIWGNRKKR